MAFTPDCPRSTCRAAHTIVVLTYVEDPDALWKRKVGHERELQAPKNQRSREWGELVFTALRTRDRKLRDLPLVLQTLCFVLTIKLARFASQRPGAGLGINAHLHSNYYHEDRNLTCFPTTSYISLIILVLLVKEEIE